MRYLVLILLNLPVILLALMNIITRYKLGKIEKRRFYNQLVLWIGLLILLISSFPVYNLLTDRPLFDSAQLSFLDIVQTVAVVALIYITNSQRQTIEQNERRLNDLHQELSIQLSGEKNVSKR